MNRADIRDKPTDEKERAYDQIHALYYEGKRVKVRQHKSGFPAVTVDCEGIHIITDVLTLEQWWAKQKERR